MKKIKIFILSLVLCFTSMVVSGCKEETPPETKAQTEAIGFIVYNNTAENGTYEVLQSSLSRIDELVTVNNGTISTSDRFLFYYHSSISKLENTNDIVTNTTIKNPAISNGELSLEMEIVYEATDILIYIIYKDSSGNLSFEFDREITNISFTTPAQTTLNFEDNSLITKINATFSKDASKQEEYQR